MMETETSNQVRKQLCEDTYEREEFTHRLLTK